MLVVGHQLTKLNEIHQAILVFLELLDSRETPAKIAWFSSPRFSVTTRLTIEL